MYVMSETNSYPDFHQPIENFKPLEAQQQDASRQIFDTFFDDVMLHNMKSVRQITFKLGEPRAVLIKSVEVEGQKYLVLFEESTVKYPITKTSYFESRDSEIVSRTIKFKRVTEEGGKDSWSYLLGIDGIVRRRDDSDVASKIQVEDELGKAKPEILEADEDINKIALSSLLRRKAEEFQIRRMEEDLGLNNQPVPPGELEGLREFLAPVLLG